MSNKIDTLLKKANSYEKLAVLIDGKSFLKSIAQGFTNQEAQQFSKTDEFGNPKSNGIPAPPASATRQPISFERTSPSPTRQPTSFDRTSPDGGFDPELIAKYEGTDQQPQGIPPVPPEAPTHPVSIPTTNIVGQYPPINLATQQVLSDLTGIPLKIDGKIGDQTRKAIEQFKQQYGVGNLGTADLEKAINRAWYNKTNPTSNSGAVANR